MQIMPATGRSVASAAGVNIRNDNDILNPANNARLGTYYLRRNLDNFGGHSMLSTAAYNAGAHRVRSWLPATGQVDPDIWAELIPFHETRDYVQRVFAYRVIYAVRLGLTPPSLNALLFPVTAQEQLAQSRENHLTKLGLSGPLRVASREFCDAPGYTANTCL
jgi:soluble lytic murein transglycosylase